MEAAAARLIAGGSPPPTGALLLGAEAANGSKPFLGQLADVRVWSRALTANEIAARRALPPDAHETSLTGYWPLDDGTANDRSLAKRHGAITGTVTWPKAVFVVPEGDPAQSAAAASYSIGRGLRGELADVQVWDLARSADEIADTRYLQLTGAEHGLAASYRCGAIVYEEPPIVPDFSIHSRDAIVHGDPYAGARRLEAVRHAETDVSRVEATIADLELRLEVAENNERYEHELATLQKHHPADPGGPARDGPGRARRDRQRCLQLLPGVPGPP